MHILRSIQFQGIIRENKSRIREENGQDVHVYHLSYIQQYM